MMNRQYCSKFLFFSFLAGIATLLLSVQPSLAAYFVTPGTYWQLNETDPGTEGIADATGTVNGTCTNCPGSVAGQVGNAFDFSGSNYTVVFPSNSVFDFSAGSGISIELWMKLDGIPSSRQVLISRDDLSNSTHWWIAVNDDGTAGCLFIDSDGPSPSSSLRGNSNVADNNWHHIVAVRDGSEDKVMIYVDGMLEGSQDLSGDTSSDDSFASTADVILGDLSVGGFAYSGIIDNVAIYNNDALSIDVIMQNFLNGQLGHYLDEEFAPVFSGSASSTVAAGFEVTLSVQAAGNPMPTYSSANLPAGASIDSVSGDITWIPSNTQGGSNLFNVVADNGQGSPATQDWNVTVQDLCSSDMDAYWKLNETDPGTEGIADATGTVNGTCTNCPGSVAGQVGNAFDFSGSNYTVVFPSNSVFDFPAGSGISLELWMRLDGIPSSRQVLISRDDLSNSTHWWIAVNDDGTAGCLFIDSDGPSPSSSLRGYSNVADNNWHHIVAVRDGSEDKVMIYVDGVLEGSQDLSGDTSSDDSFASTADVILGNLSVGGFAYGGMLDEVAVYGTAMSPEIVLQHFNADVGQYYCNEAPIISGSPALTATENVEYTYDPTATDPEGHALTWSLGTAPSGMTIDSATGHVSWTPGDDSVSSNVDVEIQATDIYGATGTQSFIIALTGVNDAPTITTTAPSTATVGTAYSYPAAATDADDTTLTWSLVNGPSGMSVNAGTGALSWTPAAGSEGDVSFTLSVSDGHGGSDSEAVTITVSGSGSGSSSGGGGGGGCFIGSLNL